MGRAYAQDLPERVMAAVGSGTGAYAAASLFRVSVSYIYKLLGGRGRERRACGLGRAAPSRSSPRMTMPSAPR
jgi:hypothetical protein